MRVALFQPDIPQNVGAAMRLCACLGVGLDIIEPCGFAWDERKIKQAALDYYDKTDLVRYDSWAKFHNNKGGRIILMTTKGALPYTDFVFRKGDVLLAGRESAGVPKEVHQAADARVLIPMQAGLRSLNVVNATAIILGEALRQTNGFSST